MEQSSHKVIKRRKRRSAIITLRKYRYWRRNKNDEKNKLNKEKSKVKVGRVQKQQTKTPHISYFTRQITKEKLVAEVLQNLKVPYVQLERLDTPVKDKTKPSSIEDDKSILQAPPSSPKKCIEASRNDLGKSSLPVNSGVSENFRKETDIIAESNSAEPSIVPECVSKLTRRTKRNHSVNENIIQSSSFDESEKKSVIKRRYVRRAQGKNFHSSNKTIDTQKVELKLNPNKRQSVSFSSTENEKDESTAVTVTEDNTTTATDINTKKATPDNVKNIIRSMRKRKWAIAFVAKERSKRLRRICKRENQHTLDSLEGTNKNKVFNDLKISLTKLENVDNNAHIVKWKQHLSKPESSATLSQDTDEDDQQNVREPEEIEVHNKRVKNNNISPRKKRSSNLYENLKQKYNLYEEPKVLLIKLETMKNISQSEFSATEIEELTNKYMYLLKNSNFLSHQKLQRPQVCTSFSTKYASCQQCSPSTSVTIKEFNIPDTESTAYGERENSVSPRTSYTTLKSSPKSTIKVTPVSKKQKRRENLSASRNLLESWLSLSNKMSPEEKLNQSENFKSMHTSSTDPTTQSSETVERLEDDLTSSKTHSPEKAKESPSKKHVRNESDQVDQASNPSHDEDFANSGGDETASHQTENIGSFSSDTVIMSDSETKTANQAKEKAKCNMTTVADTLAIQPKTNVAKPADIAGSMQQEKSLKENTEQPTEAGKSVSSMKSLDNAPKKQKIISEPDTPSQGSKKDAKSYKCVVCDLVFDKYPVLQQHLTSHKNKHNTSGNSSLNTSSSASHKLKETIKETVTTPNKRAGESEYISETNNAVTSQPKSVPSSSAANKKNIKSSDAPVSCARTGIVFGLHLSEGKSKPCLIYKDQEQAPDPNTEAGNSKQIYKELSALDCSICSRIFPTKIDLAQHLYTHTESELQQAYERAKAELNVVSKKNLRSKTQKKGEKGTLRENAPTAKPSANSNTRVANSSMANSVQETIPQASVPVQAPAPQVANAAAKTANVIPAPAEQNKASNATSHTVSAETQNATSVLDQNMRKEIDRKRLVTVCECHKNEMVNKNCLKIEIVLLCQICRILYRTMECFETHYRCPEYILCKTNRLNSRIPKLFCTKCALIFSTLPDLRHHLELHARYNKNGTTDFRCNVCKVMFIGIGSIFYNHWSNHVKNPFFLASRLSFPKTSVVSPKTKFSSNVSEDYIQVAEYICRICKIPCSSEDDFKKHELSCRHTRVAADAAKEKVTNASQKTHTGTSASSTENVPAVQASAAIAVVENPQQPKIRMICGLCNEVFFEKHTLYSHTLKKHNQLVDPQYMCISLSAIKRIVVCNVCANVSETMADFNNHWVNHNVMEEHYVCICCEKQFQTIETFLDHAKEHKTEGKQEPPSCRVMYAKMDYTCKNCNVKFKSQNALSKHAVKHWKQFLVPAVRSEISKEGVLLDDDSILKALKLHMSPSKQVKIRKNILIDDLSQSDSESGISKDTEKLQSLSDTNDVDESLPTSAGLFVDPEEVCQIEPQERAESCANSSESSVSSAMQTSAGFKNVASILQNLALNINDPQPSSCPMEVEIMEVVERQPHSTPLRKPAEGKSAPSPVLNNKVATISKTVPPSTTETSQVPKEPSPVKPKRGFLRVKNLAELMPQTNAFVCSHCNNIFTNSAELAKHTVTHESTAKNGVESCAKNVQPGTSSTAVISVDSLMSGARPVALVVNGGTPANGESTTLHRVLVAPTKKLTINKAKPVLIKPRIQAAPQTAFETQSTANRQTSNNQQSSSTTAYHKNLLVYGTVLRPNLATLREVRRKKVTTNAMNNPKSVSSANDTLMITHVNSGNNQVSAANVANLNTVNNTSNAQSEPQNLSVKTGKTVIAVKTYSRQQVAGENSRGASSTSDKHVCMICPNFTCNRLTEYLTHELTEDHMRRKEELQRGIMRNTLGTQYQHTYCNSSVGTLTETGGINAPSPSTINPAQQPQQQVVYQQITPQQQQPQVQQQGQVQQQQGQVQQQQGQMQQQQLQSQPQQHFYEIPYSNDSVVYIDQPYVVEQQDWTTPPPPYSPNTNIVPNSSNSRPTPVINNQYQIPVAGSVNAMSSPSGNYGTVQNTNSLVCTYCPKHIRFFSKELLQYHINVNHNYICEICGQHLFNLNELGVHRIKHDLIWSANAFQNKQSEQ